MLMREEFEIAGGNRVIFIKGKNHGIGSFGGVFLSQLGIGSTKAIECAKMIGRTGKNFEI